MRRAKITSLTSNADADALETARAALTAESGQAVLSGGEVAFTAVASGAPSSINQFISGDLVPFVYIPVSANADGSISAFRWSRWLPAEGVAFSVVPGSSVTTIGPLRVPPGASRAIALPLAFVDSFGATSFACGVFFQAPSNIG